MRIIARATVAGCLTLLASAITAQDQTISADQINGYFAPVTLTDHPDCDGPAEIAFSVTIAAEDLRFRLYADGWPYPFDMGGSQWLLPETVDKCYVAHGRGAERIQVMTPCGTQQAALPTMCAVEERRGTERAVVQRLCWDTAESPEQAETAVSQAMQLDLSVRVAACQSVMQFRLIDSHWAAELTVGGAVTQHEGVFDAKSRPFRRLYPQGDQPYAGLAYAVSNTIGNRSGFAQRRDSPAFFTLELEGVPVDLPQAAGHPVFLTTNVFVFPTVDGKAACDTGDCRIPRHMNMFDD